MTDLANDLFKKLGVPNMFTKQGFAIVIGLLGTGIGAYGGMPAPPDTFVKGVEKFPLLQWFLVYVLIWQGAGGFDEKMSLYGTIIVWCLYNSIIYAEKNYELLYRLGLSDKSIAQMKAEKQAEKDKDVKSEN